MENLLAARSVPFLAALTLLLAACGQSASGPSPAATSTPAAPSVVSKPARFDGLAISLRLRSDRVRGGGTLRSRLIVQNPSKTTVIDRGCAIAEGRFALVPVDDPDAELWVQPLTDCAGPHRMEPGYREESRGPDFPAYTKYGDPLPPGRYLAVLDIRGLSQRLEYPVTVQ